ncbi:FecCD family ABC transporter permease [Arthrobacter psychrochitiniphilus]|uniref:Iron ABC transporter permease n=1 Tax=Arthrobacter psychrochitiniphilus TaxID=291045 RepID=A0A2V3DUT0_9MICC|nr:iron ABC transporter permease [Arthrobacter psychrochitiniphilus]NYG15576.1 iron complex transport system permease protein [Arthrobacter psychrochitiniphilus]PXA66932.1 iron ABC transporter permease [Arthrobacter psychrochitiniphilus]
MASAAVSVKEGTTPEPASVPFAAAAVPTPGHTTAASQGSSQRFSTVPAKTFGTRRRLLWLTALVLVLGVVALVSLAIGARSIAPGTVLDALFHFDPANGDHAVVHSRVVRTVAGLIVGLSLGLAGTSMQGVARNPLADPGILGINAGASLAVVAGIFFLGAANVSSYLWFAFAGSAVAAVVVYAVASLGRSGATPVKLALAGAAIAAGMGSLMSAMLVTSQDSLELFRRWQVGALAGKSWDSVVAVLPFVAVGVVILLCTGRLLNMLALGDDMARGLGHRPGLGRAISAVGIVLLCGSATALAGPIGFIGLVVPHLLRGLVGPDYRWLLPLSLLGAPAILLAADVVGRVILLPSEVPAGILAALIGAPVFIAVVRRGKQAEL